MDVVAVTFVAVDGVEDDVVAALVVVDVATWVLLTYSLYWNYTIKFNSLFNRFAFFYYNVDQKEYFDKLIIRIVGPTIRRTLVQISI